MPLPQSQKPPLRPLEAPIPGRKSPKVQLENPGIRIRRVRGLGRGPIFLLSALLLQLQSSAVLALLCPRGFFEVGQHCYSLSKTSHTFESCQKDVCGPAGGVLACLREDNWAELRMKLGIGVRTDATAAWFGLQNAGNEDLWSWVSGCDSTWENWLPREPDHYCGGEDCAAMAGFMGKWMSASCRLRLPCLCEWPGQATRIFNASVPYMRDDTCYADCGDITKWCSAWPFLRLYDTDDDVCHWEETDGQKRGRGTSECARRVKERSDCGNTFSYSVGRCRCSPPTGPHAECTARQPDPTSDVFKVADDGAELVYPHQRCIYNTIVDDQYFDRLRPASTLTEKFRIWFRAAFIWIVFGGPCVFLMIISSGGIISWLWSRLQAEDEEPSDGPSDIVAAYGVLLDTQMDPEESLAMSRWIWAAAVGICGYGAAQLMLGMTLAMHMAGRTTGFLMELFESMLMLMCILAVCRAALMLHRRLSTVARQIAGCWVRILVLVYAGMALKAVGGIMIFSTLADQNYESICFATYLFRWSMLVTLPLQCAAGFSISRIQAAAETYAGSRAIVGGYAYSLVFGYYLAGIGIWLGGYMDCVHEAFYAVAVCFVLAALGQLIAGTSLLMAINKVKEYNDRDAADAAIEGASIPTPKSLEADEGKTPTTIGAPVAASESGYNTS